MWSFDDSTQVHYFSQALVQNYLHTALQVIGGLVVTEDTQDCLQVLRAYPHDGILRAESAYTDSLNGLVYSISVFQKIALWSVAVLLVFSIALIYNF